MSKETKNMILTDNKSIEKLIADEAIWRAQERRDHETEAQEYEDNPDNWVYDRETGVWDERY